MVVLSCRGFPFGILKPQNPSAFMSLGLSSERSPTCLYGQSWRSFKLLNPDGCPVLALYYSLWQPGMQQSCLPGLESQDGNCKGQATATLWCPAVRVQDRAPEVQNSDCSGLFCWSAVFLPPVLLSCQSSISFPGTCEIFYGEKWRILHVI